MKMALAVGGLLVRVASVAAAAALVVVAAASAARMAAPGSTGSKTSRRGFS
jgi:hypothetical protein